MLGIIITAGSGPAFTKILLNEFEPNRIPVFDQCFEFRRFDCHNSSIAVFRTTNRITVSKTFRLGIGYMPVHEFDAIEQRLSIKFYLTDFQSIRSRERIEKLQPSRSTWFSTSQ